MSKMSDGRLTCQKIFNVRERRHVKNVKTQEVASSIPARSLNQT